MNRVTAKDGTTFAFDRSGEGLAVILIDGAFCSRAFGPMPGLASLLAEHFTVYHYDRRGRNESGDTLPYSVEREVEDPQTVIEAAGGSASVYGICLRHLLRRGPCPRSGGSRRQHREACVVRTAVRGFRGW